MQSSKSKSGSSENSKYRPATPKGNQQQKGKSSKSDLNLRSTLQKSHSIDRPAKSANSKQANGHHASKNNSNDKQQKAAKGSDLQGQLDSVQEELKRTIERLASVEVEKTLALEELKDANGKLEDALAAKKRAEEEIETEKVRADELEQAGIEAAKKKEEELLNELESMRSQYSKDAKALASATEEIQRMKYELIVSNEAKNTALRRVDDAMKTADNNAERAERLSAEVNRLRKLLEPKVRNSNTEHAELVRKLEAEIDALRQELDRKRLAEDKTVRMEEVIEDLKVEISDAKQAESEACVLVDELKKNIESLESQLEDAKRAHRSSSETLASAMKEMEESNALLLQAQAEIDVLKEKMESLKAALAQKSSDLEESDQQLEMAKQEVAEKGREVQILKSELRSLEEANMQVRFLEAELARKNSDLEESDRRLEMAKQEAIEMAREVERLRGEIKALESAKSQALTNEKSAVVSVESLEDERNHLKLELEVSEDEILKLKKEIEDLSAALSEASLEARDTQELLLMKQAESENVRAEIEELKVTLKNTKENYEVILDEAKYEIVCLKKAAERMETEAKNSKDEWKAKERTFVKALKKSEDELGFLKMWGSKIIDSQNRAEQQTKTAKGEDFQAADNHKQADTHVSMANEFAEEEQAENFNSPERSTYNKNEYQRIDPEKMERSMRETATFLKQVKELTTFLEDLKVKNVQENSELSPPETESPERSVDEIETDKFSSDMPSEDVIECPIEEPDDNDDAVDKDSVQVESNVIVSEREPESVSADDELDSKKESSFEQLNELPYENIDRGSGSPTTQKKKKIFLGNFRSLLKKKNSN